jgi:hypothetical protein
MSKPALIINKREFLEWFYSDKDDISALGQDVFDELLVEGEYSTTIDEVWRQAGYIPVDLVRNPEALSGMCEDDDEIQFPATDFDVEWIEPPNCDNCGRPCTSNSSDERRCDNCGWEE